MAPIAGAKTSGFRG